MRNERRGPWYLLTGLLLGIAIGLAYAWLVSPVAYTDTPPVALRPDYKDAYRTLIALAYSSNGDLGRARVRLALLGDNEPGSVVANQALRAAAENRPVSEVQSLALLAEVLGSPVDLLALTPTPSIGMSSTSEVGFSPNVSFEASETSPAETPTVVVTEANTQISDNQPQSTITRIPTTTSTPTTVAPFVLLDREFICNPDLPGPLIQVFVFDTDEQPVPGVPIFVNEPAGINRFYTGLKPEISLGYADYLMTPGISYTLRLGESGQTVSDLNVDECESSTGESYPGSWVLTFTQP